MASRSKPWRDRRGVRSIFFIVILSLGSAASAQEVLPPAVELSVSQRWLPRSEEPARVPVTQRTHWLFVQEARPRRTAPDRRLHLVSFDVPFNAPVRGSVDATTSG